MKADWTTADVGLDAAAALLLKDTLQPGGERKLGRLGGWEDESVGGHGYDSAL